MCTAKSHYQTTGSFSSQLLLILCNELLQQQQQLKLHCTLAHSYQRIFSPSFCPDISCIYRKTHQIPPVKWATGNMNNNTTAAKRWRRTIASKFHPHKEVVIDVVIIINFILFFLFILSLCLLVAFNISNWLKFVKNGTLQEVLYLCTCGAYLLYKYKRIQLKVEHDYVTSLTHWLYLNP